MNRPWAGGKTGPNPTDRGKGGVKRSLLTEAQGFSKVRYRARQLYHRAPRFPHRSGGTGCG